MPYLTKQYSYDATTWSHWEFRAFSLLSRLSSESGSKEFQASHSSPVNSYLEGVGIADSKITSHKRGRIRLHGSWWFALSNSNITIRPGQKVRVTGRQNHTLMVELSPYS